MNYSSERTAIESRFSTLYSKTSIKWENVDFKPTPGSSFVELLIDTDDTDQISMQTTPCFRTRGSIVCIIYTPINQGSKPAREIMDEVQKIFVGQQFDGITCRGATFGKAGVLKEWYRHVMNIEFFYDSTIATS